jgi:hypothetical protein
MNVPLGVLLNTLNQRRILPRKFPEFSVSQDDLLSHEGLTALTMGYGKVSTSSANNLLLGGQERKQLNSRFSSTLRDSVSSGTLLSRCNDSSPRTRRFSHGEMQFASPSIACHISSIVLTEGPDLHAFFDRFPQWKCSSEPLAY